MQEEWKEKQQQLLDLTFGPEEFDAEQVEQLVGELEALLPTVIPEEFSKEAFLSRFDKKNHTRFSRKRCWYSLAGTHRFTAAAALLLLCVMTLGTVGYAFGIRWMDYIHISSSKDKVSVEVNIPSDTEGLQEKDIATEQQCDLLLELNSPSWVPARYHLAQCDYQKLGGSNLNYYYYFRSGEEDVLDLSISEYNGGGIAGRSEVYTDGEYAQDYVFQGISHKIVTQGNQRYAVTWVNENKVYLFSGKLSLNETKQLIQSFYNKKGMRLELKPQISDQEMADNLKQYRPDLSAHAVPVSEKAAVLSSKVRYRYEYSDFCVTMDEYLDDIQMPISGTMEQDGRFRENYHIGDRSVSIESTQEGYDAVWQQGKRRYEVSGSLNLKELRGVIGELTGSTSDTSIGLTEEAIAEILKKHQPAQKPADMNATNQSIDIYDKQIVCQYNYSGIDDRYFYLKVCDDTYAEQKQPMEDLGDDGEHDTWNRLDCNYQISCVGLTKQEILQIKEGYYGEY